MAGATEEERPCKKGGHPLYEAAPPPLRLCFKCEKLGTILEKKTEKNKKYL